MENSKLDHSCISNPKSETAGWTVTCLFDRTADAQRGDELHQRLIQFGARATRVARILPRNEEGRYISRQLMRSGLACASNYAEARAAESRADFIHKLRIVLKELNETRSWLEQIVANSLFSRDKMAAIIA